MTKAQLLGEFADAVVAALETQKPVIESAIATAEADVVAGLANLLKNLPKPTGVIGALEAPIEAAIEAQAMAYAQSAVAKYGPDAVYVLLDAQLHAWAKELGG